MFKKIIIITFLLALMVGLSYVKTLRNSAKRTEAFDKGKAVAKNELIQYKDKVDSLKIELGFKEVALADSIVKNKQYYQFYIENLETKNCILEDSIYGLSKKLAVNSKPSVSKNSNRKVTKKTNNKHQQVLAYYKDRYKKLPSDLSDYEKRIALNEIKEETAQKFKISLAELRNIRDKYKLKY